MLLSHSKLCCKNNGKIFGTVWSTASKLSYELQQARTPVLYICHPQHTWVFLQVEENTFDGFSQFFYFYDMLRSPLQLGYTFNNNLSSPLTSASLQDLLIPSKQVLCEKSLVNITKFYSYNVISLGTYGPQLLWKNTLIRFGKILS